MSLFDDREVYNPLASRLRPDDLDGFVGQEHLLGKGKLLRQLIEQERQIMNQSKVEKWEVKLMVKGSVQLHG